MSQSFTLSVTDGCGDRFAMVGMVQIYLLRNLATGQYVTIDAATMKQLTIDMSEVQKFLERQIAGGNGQVARNA